MMSNDEEDTSANTNAITVAYVDTSSNCRKVKRKNDVDDFATPMNEYHRSHPQIGAVPSSTSFSSPYQFPIGGRVVIQDLARQTELNHHLGVVEEFLEQEVRFKIRPLGRRCRTAMRAKFVSIRPINIRLAPQSAFIARIKSYRGKAVNLPLTCRVELDNENRLAVRLMYSDFLGMDAVRTAVKEIEGEHQEYISAEETAFGVVTTSFVDEDLRGQSLGGGEILILYDKPAIRDLYDAMVDYELVQELEMTIEAGLHGSFPLCRLCFPYQVEQS